MTHEVRFMLTEDLMTHLNNIIRESNHLDKIQWVLFKLSVQKYGVLQTDYPGVERLISTLDCATRDAFIKTCQRVSPPVNRQGQTGAGSPPVNRQGQTGAGSPPVNSQGQVGAGLASKMANRSPPRSSRDIAGEILGVSASVLQYILGAALYGLAYSFFKSVSIHEQLPERRVMFDRFLDALVWGAKWILAILACCVPVCMVYMAYLCLRTVDLAYTWRCTWGLLEHFLGSAGRLPQIVLGLGSRLSSDLALYFTGLYASLSHDLGLSFTGLYASIGNGLEHVVKGLHAEAETEIARRASWMQHSAGFHTVYSPLALSRKSGIHSAPPRSFMPLGVDRVRVTLEEHGARLETLASELAATRCESASQSDRLVVLQREHRASLETLASELAVARRDNASQSDQLAVLQKERVAQGIQLASLGDGLSALRRGLAEQERRLAEQEKRRVFQATLDQGAFLLAGAAAMIVGAAAGTTTVVGTVSYWMMARMGLDFMATLVCEFGFVV